MFKRGDKVTMTKDAVSNYGKEWQGVELEVTHVATAYMPAQEFYANNQPQGFHPGFDKDAGSPLYDLANAQDGTPLSMSLYGWELEP